MVTIRRGQAPEPGVPLVLCYLPARLRHALEESLRGQPMQLADMCNWGDDVDAPSSWEDQLTGRARAIIIHEGIDLMRWAGKLDPNDCNIIIWSENAR